MEKRNNNISNSMASP